MVEPEDAMSLLREIRDSAARHQQYIEERDRKQNEYLQSETERVQRIEKLQKRGQVYWVLLLVAMYLIAIAQLFK